MTFFEFLCEHLLGPPWDERGGGESYFDCPECGGSRFHTRPQKAGYKDRVSCWACGWWGDEMDLLRHFFPRETYAKRQQRLTSIRDAYEREHGRRERDCEERSAIHPGAGEVAQAHGVQTIWRLLESGRVNHHDILEVVAELNHRINLRLEYEIAGRKRGKRKRREN